MEGHISANRNVDICPFYEYEKSNFKYNIKHTNIDG